MKITRTLILGASGSTGSKLVEQLLLRDENNFVRTIVRSKERFHQSVAASDRLEVIEASLLDMKPEEFEEAVKDCDAVCSCLGHNLSMKGIYGQPRRLVVDAIERVCKTIKVIGPSKPVKVILMGSDGVANPDGKDDKRTLIERSIVGCIRVCVPPHKDNEAAADFLYDTIGMQDPMIEWVVVRPTDLIDGEVSSYDTFDKPTRGLFGDGNATRANVAHFMIELVANDETWEKWRSKMPFLLNTE